ncbi:MAG: NAD(P)H-dependent dehydrogenase/reductase [Chlorobiaceae bacterium]|nr:NAD(P)H-dependent dehydrogenase/reductase [Chlorobiaceae bacterium]
MAQNAFIALLRERRSIRLFTKETIPVESIKSIIEAALRAPSARGLNPWEFILVDDPELIIKLSEVKPYGSGFLKTAPLAIVVCADSVKADFWIEDCSIAATLIQLAASCEGLGSCWVQIRNRMHDNEKSAEMYLQELLGLPEHMKVALIVGIGYPGEEKPLIPVETLQYEKIKYNRLK